MITVRSLQQTTLCYLVIISHAKPSLISAEVLVNLLKDQCQAKIISAFLMLLSTMIQKERSKAFILNYAGHANYGKSGWGRKADEHLNLKLFLHSELMLFPSLGLSLYVCICIRWSITVRRCFMSIYQFRTTVSCQEEKSRNKWGSLYKYILSVGLPEMQTFFYCA